MTVVVEADTKEKLVHLYACRQYDNTQQKIIIPLKMVGDRVNIEVNVLGNLPEWFSSSSVLLGS